MTKLQLKSFPPEGNAAQLMAKANSEDRYTAGKIADIFLRVGDGLWIARAVRKEYTIGTQRENIIGGSVRGNDGDFAVMVDKQAEDILLYSEIVGDDLEFAAVGRLPGFPHLLGPGGGGQ